MRSEFFQPTPIKYWRFPFKHHKRGPVISKHIVLLRHRVESPDGFDEGGWGGGGAGGATRGGPKTPTQNHLRRVRRATSRWRTRGPLGAAFGAVRGSSLPPRSGCSTADFGVCWWRFVGGAPARGGQIDAGAGAIAQAPFRPYRPRLPRCGLGEARGVNPPAPPALGLGRVVALCSRSSTLYQIRYHSRYLLSETTMRPNPSQHARMARMARRGRSGGGIPPPLAPTWRAWT
jgi:hypothetical protein